MNKDELINKIKTNLTPDLVKREYREKTKLNPLWGHCYVASEAYYHLMGGKENYQIQRMRVTGDDFTTMHWFLKERSTGNIVDITANQFDFDLDYSEAINATFLTLTPSKRAQKLISKINS